MPDITQQKFIEHVKSRKIAYIVGVIVVVCGILFHIYSYSRSPTLTFCDVTLSADEGLVSLNIPLVRIAAKENPATNFIVFTRNGLFWEADKAGKVQLRNWLKDQSGILEIRMIADFGYWKFKGGGTHSPSRPGNFIVLFVPIWFVFLSIYGIFFAFYRGWIRFRLRTLFIVTAVCACLLWLLMLRAPA